MKDKTPNLGLKFVKYNQAQKEIIVNEALVTIDALLHKTAVDIVQQLPSSALDGELFIIDEKNLSEELNDKTNYFAIFANGWRFLKPQEGCVFWVCKQKEFYHYLNARWSVVKFLKN